MEEHPAVGGDTAWLSQYGLYDALSDAMKRFVDGLHAVHTSRLQCKPHSPAILSLTLTIPDDTILDSWQVGPNRPPIDTHHPAVRTHPVTGLKALNVNGGFVTGFAELKKEESDKLLEFFRYHIHSADDHYVRWKWAVGSVAMWDNVSPLASARHRFMNVLTMKSEVYRSSSHPWKLQYAKKRCSYDSLWREAYEFR